MKKLLLLIFLLTFSIGQSQNKILNGTFAAGTANWGFGSPGVVSGGEAYYSTANAGAPAYGTELKQQGMTLTSGAIYTVTFRARAAANRLLSVNIQNTNVWNDHFRNDAVALTTTMTTYSYSFTATATSNSANNVQLNFHMAGLGTNTTAAVYIDDVSIMPGNVTATPCANGIQDIALGETGVDCGGSCGACLTAPTYGAFTVPAKLTNSAPFTLTPPTSTNTSSFTYTSSNTAVATVSGSTVTIVGAGTSTITANQVSDGTYSSGSTTASLVVTVPLPATPAPNPPARNSWDVISYYSDTNIGSVYAVASAPTWGGQTSDTPISGNATKFLGSYLFGQIAFANKNVTSMSTLHIDLYSLDQTTTWIWLNNEKYIVTPVSTGVWTSLDIPLSTFVVADKTAINIIKIESPTGAATPLRNVYVDNIYFYRAATSSPPTLGALSVPSPKVFGDAPFTITDPTSNSSGTWTYSSSPTGVVTFSGNTATIVGGGTTTITATQAAVPGIYGAGTASASLVVNYPAPGASPIPPLRDSASVVSLYTGTPITYANVRTAVQASWSTGSTTSNFIYANGTDTCIQVNNLGFFGLVGNTNFSVVGMTKLHVDIYVNSPMTTMILNLLAPADRNYSIGPLTTGWNSFDIPLTTYPGALNDIAGIKFEQSGGTPRQIYIDNVYFYYTPTTPTISNFSSVAKVMGAAPFTLSATSDSSATITYTSTNTGVATISGNTVTVVGAGTTTLTASQVATGTYAAGSATATLTVTASTSPLAGPTTPPARNTWDVFSIFSDAYTPVAGTRNYNPGWGQAGSATLTTAGTDNVWRASNLNYQGIVFGSIIDVSAMTHFHVDVWTFDETSLQFFQISNTTGEKSVALAAPYPALNQGSWISYDIPLTAWTSQSGFTTTALKEFKIVGSGGKTIYMDNMYFYRAATTQPPTIGAFTVPTKLIGDAAFTLTPPTSNSAGAFTYTSSNTAVATISGDVVTIVGAGSSTITATQAADGGYGTGSSTATLSVTPPAAPTPIARNTWDVISLYSNSYATSSSATWGGVGTDVTISGNNTRLLSGSPTYRLPFTATNVSAMTTLHIDVYALNQSSWQFRLNDKAIIKSTPVNGWTSIDILLSEYAPQSLNLTNVSFFDFFNPNGANPNSSYLDNVYFYRDATDAPPTLGALTVPSPKVFGDAPFTLTDPTSNSSGTWTYSSSPTGVVTFIGNTATVVGGGTTTITATQAAVPGVFGAGTASASLVVNYPAPGASPIPPTRDSTSLVSMYTGTPTTYANGTTAVQANWSTGSTNSNFSFANGTNTCIQVNNLGFFGLVTNGANFSVVGMTKLHVDIYVNSPMTTMILNLLAPTDRNYSIGPLITGWNSFDIPLTTYPGALNDIAGIKFEQSGGTPRQIYLDNIYFYKTATWSGTTSTNWATASNWAEGSAPTATSDVVIASSANQPIIGSDVSVNSLTINTGTTLTVNSGFNLTVTNSISNSGTMTLQNNANLLQNPAATTNSNTGSITVKRNSAPLLRLDHTLWSSPVTGSQTLQEFSPDTLPNRFYTYTTSSNSYTAIPANSTFTAGKGVAIRTSNINSSTVPTIFSGTFTGVPNNGTVSFTLATGAANGFDNNLLGNPYPSTIDVTTFLDANPNVAGTIYFYTHSLTMDPNTGLFPSGTNYSSRNRTGHTLSTRIDNDPHLAPPIPNGTIQVGQGFIVKSLTGGNVSFTNAMRINNNNNQFMRTTEIERHRLWLNLATESGTDINQIAVAYVEGATQNADTNFDGLSFGNTGSMLSSKIDNSNYVIQGRSLPFNPNDVVALGFKAATAGNYKIILTDKDGLFLENQDVFVRDNLMGTEHNIKISPYNFSSETGTFDNRFQLVYAQVLGIPSTDFTPNSVVVYKNTDWFHVTTKGITMKNIQVYDVSGRLIFKKSEINTSSTVLSGLKKTNEVLFLKITSQDNGTVTVKVIN